MSISTRLYPTHNSHWKETIERNMGHMQKLHHENTVKKALESREGPLISRNNMLQ
jgi:hypothetical protein